MTWTTCRRVASSVLLLSTLVLGAGLIVGCGALDVSNPTLLEDEELNSGAGADLMRKGALSWLTANLSTAALESGMLADEFLADPNPSSTSLSADEVLDRRESLRSEELGSSSGTYARWHEARRAAAMALGRLRTYMSEPPRSAYIGQMFAVRGFATLRLAEDFCPGFPLNDVVDYRIVHGPPRTTVQAFEQALADFDSALVYAADSVRFLHLARVGRARTLLGLGRFAEAAAAVGSVPTPYVWNAEFSTSTGPFNSPLVFFRTASNNRRSVADREGGTGLDYISAHDPRVQVTVLGPAYDGATGIYAIGKYPTQGSPIVLASGIEARLIEAEAALRAGDPQWLTILNELRRNQVTPALADTTDPGTEAARVDLFFRERAFWLFATGHRLGDLRRLVQHYGRAPETVFPSGAYRVGDLYGTGTSLPFPAELESAHNPAVTGCTSR